MFKVEVFNKGKQLTTHWYNESAYSEAENCAYALHNHPLFKYRTVLSHAPNAKIIYDSSKV